ncbi:hypothetical protein HYW35_00645 [Candidatus Saccharibacteria bacterium]|nr:hypothetical protein [Candidatus Saccharibacteria bacterium]
MTAKIKRPRRSSSHTRPHRPKGLSTRVFERVYWPYLPLILVISLLTTFSFQNHVLPSAFHNPIAKVLSYATQMSVKDLLTETNDMRALNNVSSLKLNQNLNAAAQAKANDMAKRNYWSHTTPDGNQPWIFVANQNYSYQKLGENLAAGFGDSKAAVKGWMSSAGHRQNLLDPLFSEAGFGFANNPDYAANGGPMTIVVAFYGRPTSAPVVATKDNSTLNLQSQDKSQPVTSLSDIQGSTTTKTTSRAQVALANLPVAGVATTTVVLLAAAALGIWIGRHALAVRRALRKGETYVATHPAVDFSLLVIAGLSLLLSRAAGFIT